MYYLEMLGYLTGFGYLTGNGYLTEYKLRHSSHRDVN